MISRSEVEGLVRNEVSQQLAVRPVRRGFRLPKTWRGNVQVNVRAASLLGIRTLSGFVTYVLANIGGGGGGSSAPTECPPCVGPATRTYNAAGVVTQIEYGAPVQVTEVISRDGVGRITETATTWAAGTRTCTFTRDAQGRVTTTNCAFVAA
ncbi:MAG: hypothetical protein ACRBN8_19695 [Nannocystales bacterium]